MSRTPKEPTASAPTEHERFIASRLRQARLDSGESLQNLSYRLARMGHPMSASQLNRIENCVAVPNIRDIDVLCQVLSISPAALYLQQAHPWYIVRSERAKQLVEEAFSGKRVVERGGDGKQHNRLMEAKVYSYIPLENTLDYVINDEAESVLGSPKMRAYLFRVGRCDSPTIELGLDHHTGEEFIVVLEGEIEFWYRQPGQEREEPKRKILRAGDCLHYSSEIEHAFRSPAADKAYAIFVYAETKPAFTAPELKEDVKREAMRPGAPARRG